MGIIPRVITVFLRTKFHSYITNIPFRASNPPSPYRVQRGLNLSHAFLCEQTLQWDQQCQHFPSQGQPLACIPLMPGITSELWNHIRTCLCNREECVCSVKDFCTVRVILWTRLMGIHVRGSILRNCLKIWTVIIIIILSVVRFICLSCCMIYCYKLIFSPSSFLLHHYTPYVASSWDHLLLLRSQYMLASLHRKNSTKLIFF